MDIQKKIKGLLLRALLLIAFVIAATLFINLPLFDDPLHPELVSLSSPGPVSMDDNTYPLVHGFSAAEDKDANAVGLAIVRKIRERHQQGEETPISAEEMSGLLGGTDLDEEWRSIVQSVYCNSRLEIDCAGTLIAEIESLDFDQSRVRILLERYEQILQAPRFQENEEVDSSTLWPDYGLLMHVSRVRLANSFQHDTTEHFLAKVDEDLHFWRIMLRDGQSMIAKMVALAGFRNNLEFLSAFMRLRDLDSNEIQSIRDLLRPLTSDELDIGESFLAEIRMSLLSDNPLFVILGDYSGTTKLFLQERATLNEYYLKMVTPLVLRAALSAGEFYDQKGYDKLGYHFRVFPPPLFNVGGKLALQRMSSEYNLQDYISRMHDVNGRVALVLLQAEIEERPDLGIEDILQSTAYRNPYTDKAMSYDSSANTIGFECLTESPTDVCSVRIGRNEH